MTILSKIRERLRNWWWGEFVEPDNGPDQHAFFLPGYDRPRVRLCFEAIARFYKAHWQWLWSSVIAVLSLVAAVAALK